ncbi:4Fe-4S dicluster domain-containing protein [Thermodesulfobacteriota bacterium B35]
MTLVTPDFVEELQQYGDDTVLRCFNCGTCVAICPLINDSFPRRLIRYIQIGARDRILAGGRDLWQCLHCGLCSRTCPRQADPAEVILSLKRLVLAAWREEDTKNV